MDMINGKESSRPSALQLFAANGYALGDMDEKELMRFVLDSCISRRKRSLEAENALIDRLGSVSGLLFASLAELRIGGVLTEEEIKRLKLIGAMFVKTELEKLGGTIKADDEAAVGRYLPLLYLSHPVEVVYLIPVVGGRLGEPYLLSRGTQMNVGVDIGEIIMLLGRCPSCKECILVHSHPCGSAKPSAEDIQVTERIFYSLFSEGYFLREHYVLGTDGIGKVPYDKNPLRYCFR